MCHGKWGCQQQCAEDAVGHPALCGREQQQGHFDRQQLKMDFLSWVCKQLLLHSPHLSIWESQVWDRHYNSNLESNLTVRALRTAAENKFKGCLGRAPVGCHLEGSIFQKAIKKTQKSLCLLAGTASSKYTWSHKGEGNACIDVSVPSQKNMLRAICTD